MKKLLVASLSFTTSSIMFYPTASYATLNPIIENEPPNITNEVPVVPQGSSSTVISTMQLASKIIFESATNSAKQLTATAAQSPSPQSLTLASQAWQSVAIAADLVTESFNAKTVQEATKALEKLAVAVSKTSPSTLVAPETKAPETKAPETKAPETKAPETKAPETKAPETKAPETKAPETKAPASPPINFHIEFSTGLETSTFSNGTSETDTDNNLFDKNYGFIKLSAPWKPTKDYWLMPSIRLGRENISSIPSDSSVAKDYFKDAQVIDGSLTLAHKIENSMFTDGTNPYWKISPGFIYTNEDVIKKEFRIEAFSTIGLYYSKKTQKEGEFDYSGSYLSIGPGFSEKYDHDQFRIISELYLNFKSFTVKENVNPFISFRIDAGNGPDDFKVFYGLTFNDNFVANIFKDPTLKKTDSNAVTSPPQVNK